jgi:starch synthase
MRELKVLSVNTGRLGNSVYQTRTQRDFARHVAGVQLQSFNVTDHFKKDIIGLAIYYCITRRLPVRRDRDWDWYRFRDEYAQSLMTRRFIQRTVAKGRPDVLHIHTQSIALASIELLRTIPSVISIEATTAMFARIHPAPAQRTYRPTIRLERQCFQAASHIVCFSENARRSAIADYGIARSRTSVIRPTIDFANDDAPRREHRNSGRTRLLFVGNDFIRKGGFDLVKAYASRLKEGCELDVVSNDVTQLPDIPGLRLHRGLTADSVVLRNLYKTADIFVLPTHEDASPIVYLEAMAAGLPCIGTMTMAVPELVRNSITGLTVNAGDETEICSAIETLSADPMMRERMGHAGRQFVLQECDCATNSRRLANIFASVAKLAGTSARHAPVLLSA